MIPEHVNPSPLCPALHEHVKLPGVLMQVALSLHGDSLHSSLSENNVHNITQLYQRVFT